MMTAIIPSPGVRPRAAGLPRENESVDTASEPRGDFPAAASGLGPTSTIDKQGSHRPPPVLPPGEIL